MGLQGEGMEPFIHIDSVGTPFKTTMHAYLFKTLPIIKSHLHTKFAIVNPGEKMLKLFATNVADAKRVFLNFPILRTVVKVWIRGMDLIHFNDQSFNVLLVLPLKHGGDSPSDDNNNDDNDSDYDNQTIPCPPHL
jgi:hypothetical protein